MAPSPQVAWVPSAPYGLFNKTLLLSQSYSLGSFSLWPLVEQTRYKAKRRKLCYNTNVFTFFFPYIQHLKCRTHIGPFLLSFSPSNTFFFEQASADTAGFVITNLLVFEDWKKLNCKPSVSEENSLSIQGGEDNETSSALLIGVLSHCLFTRYWADSACGNWFLNFRCLSWTAFQYINIDYPVLGGCAQSSVL